MAFHDVLLPDGFQYASSAGPGFQTIIQQSGSGHETRVQRQSQAMHRLSLIKALQTTAEAQAIKSFALERRGALHSFKARDFSDYTSRPDGQAAPTNVDQIIGTGTGSQTIYQIVKRYGYLGPSEYTRTVTLPESGTVVVAVDAVAVTAFTVSGTGQIIFDTAPADGAIITAGYRFYVPVRFSLEFEKWARLQADAFAVWSTAVLDVQEVPSEVEQPERHYAGGSRDWGNTAIDIALSFTDGMLHNINPTAAINVFLPLPPQEGSGRDLFVIHVPLAAASNIQLRDDAGNTVGSAFGSGGGIRNVHLLRTASGTTWIVAA